VVPRFDKIAFARLTLTVIDYERNQKNESSKPAMVKVSKDQSRRNKSDIIRAAGVVVRRDGLEAASVGQIAKEAGLTHGAVYSHYSSKTAIAAEAIRVDFRRIIELLEHLINQGAPAQTYIDAYLANDHRDYFIWGCPAGALGSEVHRHPAEVQNAFGDGLHHNIQTLARLLAQSNEVTNETEAKAMAVLAALTGTIGLARAIRMTNPTMAEDVMTATRKMLNEFIG
jgi:TetR/AcrR family transcriptional regulator, transcriptional repressor for nem operon